MMKIIFKYDPENDDKKKKGLKILLKWSYKMADEVKIEFSGTYREEDKGEVV